LGARDADKRIRKVKRGGAKPRGSERMGGGEGGAGGKRMTRANAGRVTGCAGVGEKGA
jgi:hypothetical protein